MTWWIFIHFYLWQNSLRRWWEQPLSLLSKLVVAGLLGMLGAFVILGLRELGAQLDRRLNDRETLAVVISETIPKSAAAGIISSEETGGDSWRLLGNGVSTFLQAAASAEVGDGPRVPVVAVANPERHGLVDDFYLLTRRLPENQAVEFLVGKHRSEAWTRLPPDDVNLLMGGRDVLMGDVVRLSAVLSNGFTRSTILHAGSLADVRTAHDIGMAMSRVEGRQLVIQSNLRILLELEKVRSIQAQSLWWVTIGSSAVLGLVFGSLAWMEFREERYLLSLIRTFGVGRWTLLAHALIENCILATGGVLLGFGFLQLVISRMNLDALKMSWLGAAGSLYGSEGQVLLLGAALGGILACLPIAIGLRKPLGLVLK
ncbi:MAG: hypothetical protein Q8Q59_15990 [Luteolibacter sp.]|jgi:hypothetical protein|nr:hypothetical protein [Luteolibacter sp.]